MGERLTLAQRLIQARNNGVPSIVANFAWLMSASAESLTPNLLIATGDVLSDDHRNGITPFTTWFARPLIAEALAQNWGASQGARDGDQIMARAYGELTAVSAVRGKSSLDDRNNSRLRVIRSLQMTPPSVNEIRSLVTDIVRRCKNAPQTLAPLNECRDFIHGGHQVSTQKLLFYTLRGHLIPSEIFADQASSNAWTALSVPNDQYYAIADETFELSPDYRAVWLAADERTILGYYEGKAVQNPEKTRGMIGGAMFCYLVSLTKESNITQSWVQRRKMQFQNRVPGVNFDAYINDSIVRHYSRMYLPVDSLWTDVYRQLVVGWSLLQVSEGITLTWIMEQYTNNNVTCLTTIADVVAKLKYFDVDLLIRKGVPADNFRHAITQARDLLRNPYCSLVRPTVHLRQYADLAFLCTYIKRDLLRVQAFAGYRGQSSALCTRTEAELRQLATAIYDISREMTGSDLDANNIFLEGMGNARNDYKIVGDHIFHVPQAQREGAAAVLERNDEEAIHELQQEARERRQLERVNWPRSARSLPDNARLLSQEEIDTRINEQLTDTARAFILIMQRMYALQNQVPLVHMPSTAVNIPDPERQLANDVSDAIRLWGVDVPEEWLRETPAYEGAQTIGPRPTVNAAQIAAPAPAVPRLPRNRDD